MRLVAIFGLALALALAVSAPACGKGADLVAVAPGAPAGDVTEVEGAVHATRGGGSASGEGTVGRGNLGTLGHGAGGGDGFGAGHGRLGGGHVARAPTIALTLSARGDVAKEVATRIVRQNLGRFRLCYENQL